MLKLKFNVYFLMTNIELVNQKHVCDCLQLKQAQNDTDLSIKFIKNILTNSKIECKEWHSTIQKIHFLKI